MTLTRLDILRKSFVPIILVIAALFMLLFTVKFKVALDADRITVIEIGKFADSGEVNPEEDMGAGAIVELARAHNADPLYEEAARLTAEGKWDEAEGVYASILSRGPTSQALSGLGFLYYRKGEKEKALETLNRALSVEPVNTSAYFTRAVVLGSLGREEEAVEDYKRLLKEVPYHYEANYNMGLILKKSGNLKGALESLKRAVDGAAGERKARALVALGNTYRKLSPGDRTHAADAYGRAVKIQPDNIRARFMLASMEPDTDKGRQRALRQYEMILKLKPNFTSAYFKIAMILNSQGKRNEAISTYKKAIRFNPEFSKARYNLGLLYLAGKRWSDARGQFEWLVSRDPSDARSHFNLARALFGAKDYAGSIEEYTKAVDAAGGDYPKAYVNMGRAYRALKEYGKAERAYLRAIELKGDYPEARYNLGLLQVRQGRFDEAEASYRTAIRHNPRYWQAWFNLGVLYSRMDRDDDAIDAYTRVLDIRPGYKRARLNLAVRYIKKEMFKEAIGLYRSVLARDDTYAIAWINLGLAYDRVGDNAAAMEALTRAMELDPYNYKPKLYMAHVLQKQAAYNRAVKLLREVVDMRPSDAGLRVELARALRAAGRISEAESELKKGLLLQPENEVIKNELKGGKISGDE